MKQVLIVISPGFPRDEQDSTCLPALRMFLREELIHSHFDVRVLSMHYPFEEINYLWHGLPVKSLGGKNKKAWHRIPLYIKTWLGLKQLISKVQKPIVLSIFGTEAALVASYFCKWHRLKHYCWLMGQDAKKENKFIRLISKQTNYIAISEFLKQTFETNFTRKTFGLVPSALYLPDLPIFKVQERNLDFICVGSLIPIKRIEWALQVIKDLKSENILANLVIVGDGPEQSNLESLCHDFGISNSVKFIGQVSHSEVIEQMMTSKILLHPSKFEGFGNVLLEALYAGCYVVSSFDPLNGKETKLQKVSTYVEFYTTAKGVLQHPLEHSSIQNYTTKQSAELFIGLTQNIDDSF